jgi:hypothetical protein
VDVGWLIGADLGENYRIGQAIKQIKFKMNKTGVEVKVAVAATLDRCVKITLNYVFDKPFYCWITREGCSLPYFVAYLDKDCWVKTKR